MKKFQLTVFKDRRPSVLRSYFNTCGIGTICHRGISLQRTDNRHIVNLENRPSYSPSITITDFRKIEPGSEQMLCLIEEIHGSNEFVEAMEKVIRAMAVNVPGEDYDHVPAEYRHYFDTDFSLHTVDVLQTKTIMPLPDKGIWIVEREHFKSVDMSMPATLRLIPPEKLIPKLEEIEAKADFNVTIEEPKIDGGEISRVLYQELRRGNEHATVFHTVFHDEDSPVPL